MKKINLWFLALLCVVTVTPRAFALVDLGLAGGISLANQSVSESGVNPSSTTKTWLSYGIVGNVMFPGSLGVFAGLLYTEMGSHINANMPSFNISDSVDEKVPYYQIPVALEYWFGEVLGLGAGFYYGTAAGNVTDNGTETVGGVTSPVSTSNSFSTQNYSTTDYGLIGIVDSHIPLGTRLFFSVKGIYEYGLQNYSNISGTSIKNSSILVLGSLGLRFL